MIRRWNRLALRTYSSSSVETEFPSTVWGFCFSASNIHEYALNVELGETRFPVNLGPFRVQVCLLAFAMPKLGCGARVGLDITPIFMSFLFLLSIIFLYVFHMLV